jgi:tRNA G10  N-methylase Trm11
VALHRERRLAHSLKRDIRSAVNPPIRFTNVDDVTQNHANQRAIIIGTIAKSVFRNAAFHFATKRRTYVSSARFAARAD